MIKVLIVDDSAFIRKVITDILMRDEEIEIVGVARNGKEALEKIPQLKPDIITLDVEMPLMDGITALKTIVNNFDVSVIMLSCMTIEGADLTLYALEIGAFDFIHKPKNIFSIDGTYERREIIQKVKTAYRFKNKKYSAAISLTQLYGKKIDKLEKNTVDNSFNNLIAIGTSTGGPRALQEIIPKLPSNINSSIVVVQHMPAGFTKSLANRLNNISKITVKEGEDGEKLKRGHCYIAPGNYHMTVRRNSEKQLYLKLDQNPPVLGLRPTVDYMMESIAELKFKNTIGVILTGMGSDGAEGITQIKKENGFTIAQDEETCVVFGMPKSAIKLGSIDKVLPIYNIANELINRVGV